MFEFTIKSKLKSARTGTFITPHGAIKTPVFMPVGTYGAVKTLAPWEVEALGSQIILGNTYHLYLRPGDEEIAKLGGLHKFINWPHPILTDSGGFQVYSIGDRQKINEEGIIFRSHIDGSEHKFTPEKSMQIQQNLGADIIMAFDDVAGISQGPLELKKSMERTHRWLTRCIVETPQRSVSTSGLNQALFGIVQGGYEADLRKKSAEFVANQNLPGNAIGGLAMPGDFEKSEILNSKLEMWETVELVNQILPENKPRYLMGVGEPADLVKAISLGCDMFDCVLPTRLARHGTVWIKNPDSPNYPFSPNFYKRISLLRAEFKSDPRPIDENCSCPACSPSLSNLPYLPTTPYLPFSRAYLRHLLITNEVLGIRLLSMHNIWFLNQLVARIKAEIDK